MPGFFLRCFTARKLDSWVVRWLNSCFYVSTRSRKTVANGSFAFYLSVKRIGTVNHTFIGEPFWIPGE